jgi:predicted Fe-Mo cluster-binding NifX family protein
MKTDNITIAFATDDGTTISPHFGRALYFEVLTLKGGAVIHRERRAKTGHHSGQHGDEHHHGDHHHGEHGQERHRQIASGIADCGMVVARGMGQGAYDHLAAAQITPLLTNDRTIDEAVRGIIDGTIVNHVERLH